MNNKPIVYINAEFGAGAEIIGCEKAPAVIGEKTPSVKNKTVQTITVDSSNRKDDFVPALTIASQSLADAVITQKQNGNFPIVIGGEHSTGFGTWSGATAGEDEYGILWIDAHFDMHTPETTISHNRHGMTVAGLLGYGDESLMNISYNGAKVKPENMTFIGVRSYEPAERELIEKLGIKVFYASAVRELGFEHCFTEIIDYYQNKGIKFGISFDMDCLDISEITALGTPVDGGLILNDVIETFNKTDMNGLDVLEVVEYNPELDKTGNDIIVVQKVLSCFDNEIEVS